MHVLNCLNYHLTNGRIFFCILNCLNSQPMLTNSSCIWYSFQSPLWNSCTFCFFIIEWHRHLVYWHKSNRSSQFNNFIQISFLQSSCLYCIFNCFVPCSLMKRQHSTVYRQHKMPHICQSATLQVKTPLWYFPRVCLNYCRTPFSCVVILCYKYMWLITPYKVVTYLNPFADQFLTRYRQFVKSQATFHWIY